MSFLEISLIFLGLGTIGFALISLYWAKKYFSAREEIASLKAQTLGQDGLLDQMKALASQALQGNTESFLQLTKADQEKHKLAMENLLQPIKQSLEAYKKELSELDVSEKSLLLNRILWILLCVLLWNILCVLL